MTAIIEARGLTKSYGGTPALRGVDLNVAAGPHRGPDRPQRRRQDHGHQGHPRVSRRFDGELKVLGRDPRTERNQLMNEVCFIADVAVLPRWLKVSQALDFVAGVHPRFDRKEAEEFLAKTDIRMDRRVRQLSKGMVTQLHLALILAIDARLLVLDEPTLGLDLLFRRSFYDNLLNDYFDKERTILVTTHQVEEIENILTDVIVHPARQDRARFAHGSARRALRQLVPAAGNVERARALKPIDEREVFGRAAMLFDGRNRAELEALGETRTPSVADLFVAMMRPEERARGLAEGGRMNNMLMLVRREFWEHRSLWIAPLVWAGIIIVLSAWLFFVIIPRHAPEGVLNATHIEEIEGLSDADREEVRQAIETAKAHDVPKTSISFSFLGISQLISSFACIVVFFYLIDCLFTERRDRSILFWKSLPLSDTQVVLSKLAVALIVVPIGVVVLAAVTQFVLFSLFWLKYHGTLFGNVLADWNFVSWMRALVVEFAILLCGVIWYAPIAAYFLLLSVWARKLVFLWAIVPFAALPALGRFFLPDQQYPGVHRAPLHWFRPGHAPRSERVQRWNSRSRCSRAAHRRHPRFGQSLGCAPVGRGLAGRCRGRGHGLRDHSNSQVSRRFLKGVAAGWIYPLGNLRRMAAANLGSRGGHAQPSGVSRRGRMKLPL